MSPMNTPPPVNITILRHYVKLPFDQELSKKEIGQFINLSGSSIQYYLNNWIHNKLVSETRNGKRKYYRRRFPGYINEIAEILLAQGIDVRGYPFRPR